MKKDYVKYLIGLLLFGSNGVIASHIALTSGEIVFLRSILGSALLIGLFLFSGHRFTVKEYKKDALFIASSGVAMAADWLLLFEAYQQMGVSLSIIINYCGPAIAVALSLWVFKDKLTTAKTAALLAALMGTFLVNGFSAGASLNAKGLLCAALSAFSYAAVVIFNKCSRDIRGTENAALQLFFTAVTVTAYMGIRYGYHMAIPSNSWPWILWLGLVNTGLGCYFYFSAIGGLPVHTVAICGYLEPLSAVLFSLIFLHERLSPLQWAGAALIIGGALLSECTKPKMKTYGSDETKKIRR